MTQGHFFSLEFSSGNNIAAKFDQVVVEFKLEINWSQVFLNQPARKSNLEVNCFWQERIYSTPIKP